jgi:bacillithiol biosynthesis deacetylase BshB1
MKLDILAFGAHPDDIELSCAGTLALQASLGHACGVVDLTNGELGTRGTPQIRLQEAKAAADILQLKARENLGFKDGFFTNDLEHQLEVVKMIRKYQPEIVLANAPTDRHPDHGRGAALVKQACFLAGLRRVSTQLDGEEQEAYRPQQLLHYIQFQNLQPDFIVNISEHIKTKVKSIEAYKSQFYDPNSNEPKTVISSKNFLDSVTYRAQDLGRLIGVDYAEGFIKSQDLGISNLMHLSGVR